MGEKDFSVHIYTPKCLTLSAEVEALTCRGLDGELGILKNHMPCVVALDYGLLKLKRGGVWTTYVCSEGFMEVYKNRADLYVDFCREEENLAHALAELERMRASDVRSVREHWKSEIHLARIIGGIRK